MPHAPHAPHTPDQPRWYHMLAEAVNAGSAAAVAAQLGVSRTAVSLLLAHKYPGGTERMAARIMERLGGMDCPAHADRITRTLCAARQSRPLPTSSPAALRSWLECRSCPHNTQIREV